ncbi:MAG TPA: DUF1700 domain-containing protein [Clostridia bacterium]|nr:DUF1700 domain-containing protein [Clostridia bacterium]
MNKQEFMTFLTKKLHRFDYKNIQDAVSYYDEIIDDKVREGMSEEEAVASLGNLNDIVAETASEMVADNKIKNPGRGLFLLMATILSPVILPLAIVILTLYVVIFAVWISLIAAFGASALGVLVGGFFSVFTLGDIGVGILILGLSLIAFVILAALCVVTVKYGKDFINLITVKLIRKLSKKFRKEENIK